MCMWVGVNICRLGGHFKLNFEVCAKKTYQEKKLLVTATWRFDLPSSMTSKTSSGLETNLEKNFLFYLI